MGELARSHSTTELLPLVWIIVKGLLYSRKLSSKIAGVFPEWIQQLTSFVALHEERNPPFDSGTTSLIWCDPVNIFEWLVWFLHLSFRGQGQPQPWQVMATIDQADIRGSKPHNHDPSGAASD